MSSGSLKLGRLAGIAVNLHWSVALVAVLLVGSLSSVLGWTAAVIGVVLFMISILAHELAHALVARRFDVDTDSIELWALGGIARLNREAPSPKAEGSIAVAGPLASLLIGVIGLAAYFTLDRGSPTVAGVAGWVGIINVMLAVFNMLPGAPLDGGRVVKALRWKRHGNRHRAMREAGTAGVYLGWIIAAIGFALIVRAQSGIWLLITGAFIGLNAKAEIIAATLAERLQGVTVRDLIWFGVASAGSDMDADSMLWQRQRLGEAGAVAVRGEDGELDGLVLEDALWAIPGDQRPWVMLTQLMVPFDRLARADLDEELASVLPRLNPSQPVVTVWDQGRLLGVVPPKRLAERLAAARA